MNNTKKTLRTNKHEIKSANNFTIIDNELLPKLNYTSLLIDEYADKNTSLSTEALALKYLKKDIVNNGMSFILLLVF